MDASETVEQYLDKTVHGHKAGFSVQECLFLSNKLKGDTRYHLPSNCEDVLGKAQKAGVLTPSKTSNLRRKSTISGQTWDLAHGHGTRHTLYGENIPGGMFDKPQTETKSMAEIYLESKNPADQEKIRKNIVRMASRGAKPRIPVAEESVEQEKRKELQRRMTRRKTMHDHNRKHSVFAASTVKAVFYNN